MTNENILFGLHHLEGALTGCTLVATCIDWDLSFFLSPVVPTHRGVCHERFQPMGTFVVSMFVAC